MKLRIDNIGQLVTPAPSDRPVGGWAMSELEITAGTSLLVLDGVIQSVGGSEAADRVVDAQGGVVTPGLVDAHTHVPFLGLRAGEIDVRIAGSASYLDQMSSGGGLFETVDRVRAAEPQALRDAAHLAFDRAISCGTTTIEAKSGYGLRWDTERLQLLTLRETSCSHPVRVVPTFLGAHAVPLERERGDYVRELIERQIPEVARSELAEFVDVFVDPVNGFDHEQSLAILQRAQKAGLRGRVHADEFSDVDAISVAIAAKAATADHLIHAPLDKVAQFAAGGGIPVLLPAASLLLALGFAPARRYVEEDLPFALGSDYNPGSSPTWSMQVVLGLACACFRLSAAEALTAATINAAFSLGLGAETGVIAPGYSADLVMWEADDYREIPLRLGAPVVRGVIARGRVVAVSSGRKEGVTLVR